MLWKAHVCIFSLYFLCSLLSCAVILNPSFSPASPEWASISSHVAYQQSPPLPQRMMRWSRGRVLANHTAPPQALHVPVSTSIPLIRILWAASALHCAREHLFLGLSPSPSHSVFLWSIPTFLSQEAQYSVHSSPQTAVHGVLKHYVAVKLSWTTFSILSVAKYSAASSRGPGNIFLFAPS